ncbi:MAG: sodium:proton antiporter [Planctomycetes bacterium]|nr:sodium:proton antiporter [Planctomycetota bacterium]
MTIASAAGRAVPAPVCARVAGWSALLLFLAPAGLASAADEGSRLGHELSAGSAAPFLLLLLAIAVLPLAAHGWWHSNRNKALVSLGLGVPVGLWMLALDGGRVLHAVEEYVSFIVLLGALYVIAGGIGLSGGTTGSPRGNTLLLALGAVGASLVGTTGASMVLIQPLLQANAWRRRRAHQVVFFILLVSNIGGALTPLGDPPLFLGFLRGVPFFWTLRLAGPWAVACVVLLAVFWLLDRWLLAREDAEARDEGSRRAAAGAPLTVAGAPGFLLLAGVVLAAFLSGLGHWPYGVREGIMVALALASLKLAPAEARAANRFTWYPIVEVAVLFAGIFLTMIPALAVLGARAGEFGLSRPWQFFWGTGLLSMFLDNAPTYLTFLTLARGLGLGDEVVGVPHLVLSAISVGAVFMGANTYIGNGPNFMVRAIAEAGGVRMPSFAGYLLWTSALLAPLYLLLTVLFYA